jgi:ubiquinone/menaquinone biosynthesis C-methylase UbiE
MTLKGRDFEKYNKIYTKTGTMFKRGGYEGKYGDNKDLDKKWNRYGHAFEGRKFFYDVMSLNPVSLVDIGCGYNEFITEARKYSNFLDKTNSIGVDIACPAADVIAPAHNLPFKDKSYDLLVSFDCMEHVPEEEVEAAFKEFARVAKRIYLQISLTHSETRIDGELLHVCVKPKEWWLSVSKKYFLDTVIRSHNNKNTKWENIIICGNDL